MMLALVGLVVLVLRTSFGLSRDSHTVAGVVDATKTARKILTKRYARGEIDADDYREKLRNLGGRIEGKTP